MPRQSLDDRLTVVPFVEPLPEPPNELSESEAEIFRSVAVCMPAGWFRADSIPLLVEYSRAIDACNNLARMRKVPGIAMRDLIALLAAHEKQARMVVSLATKMRLTQQARYLTQNAGRAVANKPVAAPPWGGDQPATSPGLKNIAKSRTGS